ncbi:uncharacterized protein LOC143905509 isoform X1 [Temnothorax americanus]|uniref:uncharacterized protein LOC143905509 isoform X1 n=1 Tax=Temnothorax americanus TaxID=1964332 RepID=UPI00406859E8
MDLVALFVKHQGKQQPSVSKNKPVNNNANKNTSSLTYARIRCNYCKKLGHKAANCFSKKTNIDKKSSHATETTLLVNNDKVSTKWCLDSGCTSHLCGDKKLFENTKNISSGLKLANNTTTKIKAMGNIKITTAVDDEEMNIRLKDTLYVPDLRTNLLSVAKIVDNQHQVLFTKDCAIVQDLQGNAKMIAKRVNNLFYLQESFTTEACVAVKDERSQIMTWHERLGHLNANDVNLMWKSQAVNGIKLNAGSSMTDCKICAAGKLSSSPFPVRGQRASGALDIIHTDVCGPMRTESQGGARYFVTFIDDHTRWCEVYFMRNKGEVAEKFKEFKKLAENQTGRKIKAVQSDNGKEYCNSTLDKLFKEHGIRRRLTVAHTPEQNGVAERRNRTLVEAARCMMIQSGLSPSFWAEAIATANYIRNRCITKSLHSGTPFEKWTGRRPNISHLRTFGCKAFILDKSPNKGKFDVRGLEGIFVGYSEVAKAYRVWSPKNQKIHISRDVKFFNEFNVKESCEDIITEETKNGRFKVVDDLMTFEGQGEAAVGSNNDPMAIQFGNDRTIEDNDQVDAEDDNSTATPARRGPGRPKGATNRKPDPPSKEYDLRSRQQRVPAPIVVESSSDDDIEWQDSMYALFAGEISISEATTGPDAAEWKDAIYDEIKSLVANDTWELVERPKDGNVVGCRTILRNKYGADGKLEKRKARVVAKGFSQRPGLDFQDTFAPVARLGSLRLLVALSVELGMSISQLDITAAYLHGDMDTVVYMEPPEYLEEMLERITREKSAEHLHDRAKTMLSQLRQKHMVCLLLKALYGLRQAGRRWYLKLDETLKKAGLSPTNADPCVYVNDDGTFFLLVYVDNILMASKGTKTTNRIIEILKSRFAVKDLGEAKYCLGIEIIKSRESTHLSQAGYIKDLLFRFGMADCKTSNTPLDSNIKLTAGDPEYGDDLVLYRELVGSLMYLALGTRPDIAHAVSVLSQFNSCHEKKHWTAAKHVLRYLKNTINLALCFERTNKGLTGYVDADWSNCAMDRRSYTGTAFILAGGAIFWESRKQRTVALSSTEAEYMGLTDAAKEAVYLINFLKELGLEKLTNVNLYNDNQGARELAHNPVYHGRSKHIDIRHHFIREVLNEHPVKLEYLPTEEMVADVLTKKNYQEENTNFVFADLG